MRLAADSSVRTGDAWIGEFRTGWFGVVHFIDIDKDRFFRPFRGLYFFFF
jgi:hypothetical protein